MRSLQAHELALSFAVGVAVFIFAPFLVAALVMTVVAVALSLFTRPVR